MEAAAAHESPPTRPTPREYLQTIVLAAAIGIPAALVAALFLAAVHYFEHWLWIDLPDALGESTPPWYLVIGLPFVGAVIVLVARLWLPGDGGHEPLEGLSMAPTPMSHVPGILVASLATLSFGLVLGPEAPVVALGGAIAIFLTTVAKLGAHQRKLLSLAGSFAALSSLFGGPLVGGVFLMESAVGLGAQAVPVGHSLGGPDRPEGVEPQGVGGRLVVAAVRGRVLQAVDHVAVRPIDGDRPLCDGRAGPLGQLRT